MANPNLDDDEPPLDPVLQRVQARLRRLMIIGGATLGLGILAVFVAFIYRFFIMDGGDDPAPAPAATPVAAAMGQISAADVGLPPTAELQSVALDGTRMALAFRDGADTVTVLVDTATMTVVGQFRVSGGGP